MRSLFIVVVLLLSACVSEPLPDGFKGSADIDPIAAAKNRISLGLTYLQNGNYSQAKFNLDKALQFAPRLADAHYSIAFYYQQVGEIEKADAAYRRALDFEPKNADIANTYGAFLCQTGQYDKAKEYFLKAVNSNNYFSSAETYENLALCSQSQGQVEDALNYVQNALNHQPSRASSLLLLVQLQMEQRRWQQAKESLRRFEKVSQVSPETIWMALSIERELNNIELAKGYGDMLIRMYPSHPRTVEYVKSRDAFTKVDASGKILKQLKPSAPIVVQAPVVDPTKMDTPVNPQLGSEESLNNAVAPEVVAEPKPALQKPSTDETTESVSDSSSMLQSDVPKKQLSQIDNVENTQALAETQVIESPVQTPTETHQVADDYSSSDRKIDDPIEANQALLTQQLETNQDTIQAAAIDDNSIEQKSSTNNEVDEAVAVVTEQADAEALYHTVIKGDNLYRISLKYNVKMKTLMEWNDLEDGQAIFIGMRLLVTEPLSVEQ